MAYQELFTLDHIFCFILLAFLYPPAISPPFLSLLMSSILPHLPLVSPTLFSSELLSLAVCLACDGPEAAMLSSPVSLLFFLLPCYTQHTHKHTLSITLLYSLSACPSLSTSSLSASFPSCPSPPFSAPTPICYPAKCNVCQRHRVDTHTKRKRRKKCVQAHHLYFISSFSLHPLLWLFALNLLARNEKASEIVSEKKVTIT